jgi:hypothetical protein
VPPGPPGAMPDDIQSGSSQTPSISAISSLYGVTARVSAGGFPPDEVGLETVQGQENPDRSRATATREPARPSRFRIAATRGREKSVPLPGRGATLWTGPVSRDSARQTWLRIQGQRCAVVRDGKTIPAGHHCACPWPIWDKSIHRGSGRMKISI